MRSEDSRSFEWWLETCNPKEPKQTLGHSKALKQLYLTEHDIKYCMTAEKSDDAKILYVQHCSETMNPLQAWEFEGPLDTPEPDIA